MMKQLLTLMTEYNSGKKIVWLQKNIGVCDKTTFGHIILSLMMWFYCSEADGVA